MCINTLVRVERKIQNLDMYCIFQFIYKMKFNLHLIKICNMLKHTGIKPSNSSALKDK